MYKNLNNFRLIKINFRKNFRLIKINFLWFVTHICHRRDLSCVNGYCKNALEILWKEIAYLCAYFIYIFYNIMYIWWQDICLRLHNSVLLFCILLFYVMHNIYVQWHVFCIRICDIAKECLSRAHQNVM